MSLLQNLLVRERPVHHIMSHDIRHVGHPYSTHHLVRLQELSGAVPNQGCIAYSASNIVCNWKQMSMPTCPVPGPNVYMPYPCKLP